jgi:hypothetical protein
MTTAFSIVVVFVLSGVASVRPIRRGVPRQRERRASRHSFATPDPALRRALLPTTKEMFSAALLKCKR